MSEYINSSQETSKQGYALEGKSTEVLSAGKDVFIEIKNQLASLDSEQGK